VDRLDNLFLAPTRRDVLRWGAVCAGAALGGRGAAGQDAAATGDLEGLKLQGVVRREALFWEKQPELRAKCVLCPRECLVDDTERGYCGVRENVGGQYQTLVYGALCSANVDPIEKKPLFHYLPGTTAFSVATAGCNLECKFCQNWQISQFRPEQVASAEVPPARLVEMTVARQCPTIAYTYSEPTVFYEYMHDSAAAARQRGIGSVMISSGYLQEKPLRQLCRQLTAVKIDFKAFSPKFYADMCSGRLEPVLATLETLKDVGIWFEIVTLVVPTLNDSPEEIGALAGWVREHLGPDVPVHFTRFHPTFRVTNLPPTPVATLERCRQIALDAGLHYVYAGNVPLHAGENTYCHGCRQELIRRVGFQVASNVIRDGKCPKCDTSIPGVWTPQQALAFAPRS
jgi:pyruvate formate lyase activating enzyme